MPVIKRWRHAYSSDTPPRRGKFACPTVMRDIEPFVSYVGKDPELISSRSELRVHEKKHKVKQIGTDYKPGQITAENEAKKRELEELAKGVPSGWTPPDETL